MLLQWKKAIIGAGLAAALLALGGCTAVQFTYNQGAWLAHWWLDRYADFNDQQSQQVKAGLADWFAWHRRTQLPLYADELRRAQTLVEGTPTAAQVCALLDGWRGHLQRALAQGVPAAAALAPSFSAPQLAQVARQQAKTLAEARKTYLQPVAAERLEARLGRSREGFERLYGPLEPAQTQLLQGLLAESPFDAERWLADRQARQQALLQQWQGWVRSGASAAQVDADLRRLLAESQRPAAPEALAHQQRNNEANCQVVARVHQASTPAQRRHALRVLKGWEADMRRLASQPQATADGGPG